MIPNVLISKYLDGELSIEEDMEFRSMLAADPEAREAFDSAVLLHIAMRCEDDTIVPLDAEQRVLAFIDTVPMYAQSVTPYTAVHHTPTFDPAPAFDRTPTFHGAAKGLRARGTAPRRVLAAVAMLLVFALPFGDQFASLTESTIGMGTTVGAIGTDTKGPVHNSGAAQLVDLRRDGTPNVIPTVSTTSSIGSSSVAEPILASGGWDNPSVGSDFADAAVEPQRQVGAPSLHALFASKDLPAYVESRGPEPTTALLIADAPNVDVLVSTSFSQSFASPTASVVTTVAAGIGYAVTSNTFVGMEMGSTQYTRTNETMGLASNNSSGEFADIPGTGTKQTDHSGQLGKVSVESSPGQRYRTEVHTKLSPEGTIWGAAFVQHAVLKTGIIALNGRLGAGVGEDGMLTYGRMQAECVVFSGVSLTIGAEARYSPFRTGVIGGQPLARTYGTVISALYGLQVRL